MSKQTKRKKSKMTKEERRAKYTQRARDRRKLKSHKNTVCFQCRKRGHTVNECPYNKKGKGTITNNSTDSTAKDSSGGQRCFKAICYKCGSENHGLSNCPKLTPTEQSIITSSKEQKKRIDYSKIILPFARCFICKGMGHLSIQCEQNSHGIYVNGVGSCRICGKKDHLVQNCPEKLKESRREVQDDAEKEANVDEFLEDEDLNKGSDEEDVCRDNEVNKNREKRKVVTF